MKRSFLEIAAILFAVIMALPESALAEVGVDFEKEVSPIFQEHCIACHGPEKQKSGYRLDGSEDALKGGESGQVAILPGNPEGSPLLRFVSGEDKEMVMPPEKSSQARLKVEQIAILRRWIEQGARWGKAEKTAKKDPLDWWSFRVMSRPVVPVVGDGGINPIDAFVISELKKKGLEHSPEADRETLLRRVFFDLIGLPPTASETASFVADPSANAFEKVVDRLLASPRYGERWARHWLDVVHYGDTHGYDKDKPRPNAWPYRDYVIRAFNEDKPYSKFVQEQIAGDVLFPGTRDGIEALGFLSAGPWDLIGHQEVSETKTDGKIARHLDRDDMVSNTIGTFCSVTIHCAQCHNHKFDPFTQEDYYSLQATFAAVDRADKKYFPDPQLSSKYNEIERQMTLLGEKKSELEKRLSGLAGKPLADLDKEIEVESKKTGGNPRPEYGYHSAISANQDEVKWVQVDLGSSVPLERIVLHPCYDTFNNIGAGFGFPLRYKVEVCEEGAFRQGVIVIADQTKADRPKVVKQPQTFSAQGATARYVRVTATKLAPRKDDFIFALAELEVYDSTAHNVALNKGVSALDSIEAPPRWRRANLVDSAMPEEPAAVLSVLKSRRELLLLGAGSSEDRDVHADVSRLLAEATDARARLPKPDVVYAATVHTGSGNFRGTGASGGKPRPIFLLARGQVTAPRAEMGPGALSAFTFQPSRFLLPADASEGERRAALARWIVDPNNPLTWRSIVNRVWHYHFGRGLVDTPNDFGKNGGQPSHPELLEWLATAFRDRGGSLKELHRMIVTSRTYRQISKGNSRAQLIDANNTMLWRQNRRKLEAEALRDTVLFVSGKLDLSMGGPGWQDFVIEHPAHSPHYEYQLANPEDPKTWRRAVYRFLVRSQTQPWMSALDCADPSMRVDKRNETLSAPQALALLNNGFMVTQAVHFSDRILKEVGSEALEQQVKHAYRLALGHPPSSQASEKLTEFTRVNGLPSLSRLLFNLNEFAFVD